MAQGEQKKKKKSLYVPKPAVRGVPVRGGTLWGADFLLLL